MMGEKSTKPQAVRGMHDRLAEEMRRVGKVMGVMKDVFEKHGFEPIETPALEYWDVLSGKDRYGEEEKLIYRFKDRGGRDVGLRYDFTIPLARVIAVTPDLVMPYKRYQIQPVWRGDSPQYGRFREFYQCDVDIVGTSSMIADAEIISMGYEVLAALGLKEFRIRINSRRLLQALCEYSGVKPEKEFQVYRAMDKMDRIGVDGVAEKLELNEVPADARKKLIDTLENCESLSDLAAIVPEEGIQELETLFTYLRQFNVPKKFLFFDPWLARGLDYYTGPIFETVVRRPKIGSLVGGGRFDGLIGAFREEMVPAVGISLGLDRLMIALKELNLLPSADTIVKVLIAQFDEEHTPFAVDAANKLRGLGISTELYPDRVKLAKQFKYADRRGIPFVIVIGPDEVKADQVTIKNMRNGRQQTKKMSELSDWAKALK
jgi:histidyl-tRNA synthetase